jgi:hypothetical protein
MKTQAQTTKVKRKKERLYLHFTQKDKNSLIKKIIKLKIKILFPP